MKYFIVLLEMSDSLVILFTILKIKDYFNIWIKFFYWVTVAILAHCFKNLSYYFWDSIYEKHLSFATL